MKQLLAIRICGIFASTFMFCSKIVKSSLYSLFSPLGIRLSSALGTSKRTKSVIISEHLETLWGCLWLSGKEQIRAATRLWTKKASAFANGCCYSWSRTPITSLETDPLWGRAKPFLSCAWEKPIQEPDLEYSQAWAAASARGWKERGPQINLFHHKQSQEWWWHSTE